MPPKTVAPKTVASKTVAPKKTVASKKVVAKRTPKVYRDNINGITNPALKRLLRRASVKRISHLIYQRLRDIILQRLNEVVNIALVYMSSQNTKTLTPEYVQEALKQLGQTIAIGGLKPGGQSVFKRRTGTTARSQAVEGQRRRTNKVGVVALRDIKQEQKQSDRFALQSLPFQRLVREQFQNSDMMGIRVNALAFNLLQLYIETTVINICSKAVMLSQHAGRGTVQVKDIDMVETLANM